MPISTFNVEWLNQNSTRRYPIADDATCVDQTGSFTIPTDFLVGMDLPIHSAIEAAPNRFFIRQIGNYPMGCSIMVAYVDNDDGIVPVANAFMPSQPQRNTVYALGGVEPFEDTVGNVVVGRSGTIANQPAGQWTFDPPATWLELDVVRPILRGVQSLVLVNNGQRSVPITGDVELIAGSNMRITPIFVEGERPKIRFDALSGEGLMEACICVGDSANAPPIRSINGVFPDINGNLQLVGDQCLSVTGIEGGLQIEDKCCKPCCGCEELEVLVRTLERLNTQRATFEQFMAALSSSVESFSTVILGSRLGDRGCGSQ